MAPAALLSPLLALLVLVRCADLHRPLLPSTSTPEVTDPRRRIAGWGALLGARDGSQLEFRLGPLHGDPKRQQFETAALSRRFQLEGGQPMLLIARWIPAEPAPDGDLSAAARERPPERAGPRGVRHGEALSAPGAAIELGPIEVNDAAGRALSALPETASLSGAGNVDPLVTLLRPPQSSLGVGEETQWLLWGRAPQGEATVLGLLPDPGSEPELAAAFAEAVGLVGPIRLTPTEIEARAWHRPLAKVERKISPPRASQDLPAHDSASAVTLPAPSLDTDRR